ncbi:MAG: response regulator, partial [Oscillochloris sp.]|nr:response regulator [Oscillochloris sp.]
GIPPDRIDRLFRPFSQIDASTTRRFGGTGLGLAISQRLCELMGGAITVRSRVGMGSTFRVTFRSTAAVVIPPTRPARLQRLVPTVLSAGLRVLVAEDNLVNQQVALRMLQKMGYQADLATSGLEVLDSLYRQDYDVVLMDVQMPDMDGMDATRRLRAMLPDNRQPYIIAVTANAMAGDREACLSVGMDDNISKPMRRADLEAALIRAGPGRFAVPAVPSALPNPTLIDPTLFSTLRDNMGSDEDMVGLLEIFLQQADHDLSAMRAMPPDMLHDLSRLAHRMKGSSLSMGAQNLADACRKLEQQAHSGLGYAETLTLLNVVEVEYQRVKEVLNGIIVASGGSG